MTSTPASAPTGAASTTSSGGPAFVTVVIWLMAGFMLAGGVWALLWPESFADFVDFPEHVHFLHDLGAFQLGIGVGLLLALIWPDSLAVVLGGSLVANAVHTVNHAVDLDQGGRSSDPWLLGVLAVLTGAALLVRRRQLDSVLGRVDTTATSSVLTPFVRQKTVALTTYRRDGTPVPAPVSIVVDGDRAYVRSFEKAGKTRRLRRDARVEVAPSTTSGEPTGPAVGGQARRLDGDESRHAARLLRRKYPLLQGVLVPSMHRLFLRPKTGRTVHFEIVPDD